MQNNGPKPIVKAIKAIILHTFGVQVGLRILGLELRVPTAAGMLAMLSLARLLVHPFIWVAVKELKLSYHIMGV